MECRATHYIQYYQCKDHSIYLTAIVLLALKQKLGGCNGRRRESDVATRREHVRGLRESIQHMLRVDGHSLQWKTTPSRHFQFHATNRSAAGEHKAWVVRTCLS